MIEAMPLAALLPGLPVLETSGALDTEVRDLQCNVRLVRPGDLFAAVIDANRDDHGVIPDAIAAGAAAIVLSTPPPGPLAVPWIRTDDAGLHLGRLCGLRYGAPDHRLEIAGVTGTNGKTTTCYLLEAIFAAAGAAAGRIGTMGVTFAGTTTVTGFTTPEPPVLFRAFAAMVRHGVGRVAMEVSSHGIAMARVEGIRFAVRVLTGIGHDHLDFHGDLERYAATKIGWMLEATGGVVVPADDPRARAVIDALGDRVTTFGESAEATVHPLALACDAHGTRGTLATPAGALDFALGLPGRHNVRNAMAAVAAALHLGIGRAEIAQGLAACTAVPGRLEPIANDRGITVLVDYAHTPDALDAVLRAVRAVAQRRLIAVFGCGGDRDRTKRPIMARIGQTHADIVVLTSDNPRTEPPDRILDDMVQGLVAHASPSVLVEADRRQAIRRALDLAAPGDVVVIAGKGHETSQVIGTQAIPFDDREVVRAIGAETSNPET